jgi:hypothetical protein
MGTGPRYRRLDSAVQSPGISHTLRQQLPELILPSNSGYAPAFHEVHHQRDDRNYQQ